ncbi:MAG: glycosyltransferase family 4 protein [Gemmatimonadales bacterium]
MKVAMFSPALSGGWYELELARALAEGGTNVVLHTGPQAFRLRGGDDAPGWLAPYFGHRTQMRSYAPGPLRPLWRAARLAGYPLALARFVRAARRAHVVHVQFLSLPRLDVVALRGLAGRRPLVTTVHNFLPHDRAPDHPATRAHLALYRASTALIVHAEATRAALTGLGIPDDRITTIPFGAYPHVPMPPAPTDPLTILFFGEWRANKGFDVLLAAGDRLAAGGVRFRVLAVLRGDGPRVPMRPWLAIQTGYLAEEALPRLFAQSSVIALPYRVIDQSGVAILAHTLGRPVVASDVGGLGDLVRASGAGLLVPPGDVQALAHALGTMLDDPERAEQMGAAGRRYAQTALGWDAIAEQTLSVYERATRS